MHKILKSLPTEWTWLVLQVRRDKTMATQNGGVSRVDKMAAPRVGICHIVSVKMAEHKQKSKKIHRQMWHKHPPTQPRIQSSTRDKRSNTFKSSCTFILKSYNCIAWIVVCFFFFCRFADSTVQVKMHYVSAYFSASFSACVCLGVFCVMTTATISLWDFKVAIYPSIIQKQSSIPESPKDPKQILLLQSSCSHNQNIQSKFLNTDSNLEPEIGVQCTNWVPSGETRI